MKVGARRIGPRRSGSELRRLHMLHQLEDPLRTTPARRIAPLVPVQMLHDSLVILGSHQDVARLPDTSEFLPFDELGHRRLRVVPPSR